ncbi:MAG: hypothetical protein FP820_00180 [Sulfurimonas sp.]|jgi:hypothetical protein|nr:hypothetical protein [Sulfurimonas sp.]MBU1217755.1 hypothetical protein [bacterium]MBU1434217.1 hypothetical protein [bacterium]MBU1504312.1 hypothetical protein [bacterium]MBU3939426.1 hypothetical protein [bacterium]
MKKINLISSSIFAALVLVMTACASDMPEASKAKVASKTELLPMEKQGFLTTAGCAAQGAFQDCYLENYACGSDGCFEKNEAGVIKNLDIVLYSHTEGNAYKLDLTAVNMANVDSSINRNEVTVIGNYNADTNTLVATEIKPPPPPTKSFFKGCL